MYLILFDIDGTLVLTGRAGWRAMNRACADEVGPRPCDGRGGVRRPHRLEHSRATSCARTASRWIARCSTSSTGATSRTWPRRSSFPGRASRTSCPGSARCSTRSQQRDDVTLGLLTGNFVEGARIKLEYFDLWKYFPCGAFGGDAPNRNDLVPVAIRRAREAGIADRRRLACDRRGRHAERCRVRARRRRDAVAVATGQLLGRAAPRGRRRHRVPRICPTRTHS